MAGRRSNKIANLVTCVTECVPALHYILNNKIALPWEAKLQRVSSIMSYVVSEGRLCALKPSEWSLLLVGVALCGILALLW